MRTDCFIWTNNAGRCYYLSFGPFKVEVAWYAESVRDAAGFYVTINGDALQCGGKPECFGPNLSAAQGAAERFICREVKTWARQLGEDVRCCRIAG
jgi:hypothetical protein